MSASVALIDEGRRLAHAYIDGDRSEPLLADVFAALVTWSVVVERWATTAPEHDREVQRRFREEVEQGTGDELAAYRSAADELSFYSIGADVVLEAFGGFELMRRRGGLRPAESSWNKLLGIVDDRVRARAEEPLCDPARYLMLALKEGRHRLAAHRRPDHASMTGWDHEGIPETILIRAQMPWDPEGAAAAARQGALERLLAVYDPLMDRLNVPARGRASTEDRTRVTAILEALLSRAGSLDLDDRMTVGVAMSEAGWVTSHPTEIVKAVLRLTFEIKGGNGPY